MGIPESASMLGVRRHPYPKPILNLGHFTIADGGESPFRTKTASDEFRNTAASNHQPTLFQSLTATVDKLFKGLRDAFFLAFMPVRVPVNPSTKYVRSGQSASVHSWRVTAAVKTVLFSLLMTA